MKNQENETVSQLNKIREVREQLQNDLLCYLESDLTFEEIRRSPDTVCEIVVENFNKLLPPEEE